MKEIDVKTKFTQQEAVAAILNAVKDGGLPIEDRLILLCGIVREQSWDIRQLRNELRQEQQVNAANTATLASLKALVDGIRMHIPGAIYPKVPPARDLPAEGGSHVKHSVGAGPRRVLKGAVPS